MTFVLACGLNLNHLVHQDSLSRLGCRPLLISATGADSHSDAVLSYCQHMVGQHRHQGRSNTLCSCSCQVVPPSVFHVRTRGAWPDCRSKVQLLTALLLLRVEI